MPTLKNKDGDGDGMYTGPSGKDDTPVAGGGAAVVVAPDVEAELTALKHRAKQPMDAEQAAQFRMDAEALRERLAAANGRRELSDFTSEELAVRYTYGEMQAATGYREFVDSVEDSRHERYVFYPDYGGYRPELKTFANAEAAEKFEYDNGVAVSGPAAPERIFFRKGMPPASGRSMNHATGVPEWGVSVYLTPQVGSMGMDDSREWFFGKGRQVGIGSDEEPLIVTTGKWQRYEPPLRSSSPPPLSARIDALLAKLK